MSNNNIREFRRLLRRFEQQTQTQANNCCGISVPQCQALLEIEYLRNSSLKRISESLRLDTSTLSRTVDSLVKLDLVQRTPNSEDRRYLVLSLTEKGQKTCDEINGASDLYYQRVFQAIPKERRKEILEAFELFVGAMRLSLEDRSPGTSGGEQGVLSLFPEELGEMNPLPS